MPPPPSPDFQSDGGRACSNDDPPRGGPRFFPPASPMGGGTGQTPLVVSKLEAGAGDCHWEEDTGEGRPIGLIENSEIQSR